MQNKKTGNIKIVTNGYHPALFLTDLDEHFICKVCWQTVRDPVQCKFCENLYCSSCGEYIKNTRTLCMNCKQATQITNMRKFPQIVYDKLIMCCENYNNGCDYYGTIKENKVHKQSCEFELFYCESPLCCNDLLRNECKFDDKWVCSQNCWDIHEFSTMVEDSSVQDYLYFFKDCLEKYRIKLEKQIIDENTEIIKNCEAERDNLLPQISKLEAEIEQIKNKRHTGKLVRKGTWTCCGNDKFSIGCVDF